VRLYISPDVTHADDLFLQHKSSVRERYDKAWRNAEARGAFDLIFCNSDGEVTEGGRSNIFVKKNGCWTTPPLSAGVLPGIMRSVLLADKTLKTSETRLTLDGLRNADDLFVCNALRGTLPAFIDWTGGENGDHVGDFS
jgi:para-aminobenzoate synthetase/4-amino-4-deoxychorismate lyase